ncbi:MAG: glycosyltransferase, partial [Acidimicrobiales bacterium]
NISEAVRALFTSLPPDLQLVAACGKNTALSARLRRLSLPADRLRVLGYVTNMHEQMAAADVVVTNGAGVTVLEALCTSRPVVAFSPLAGHGSASTNELVRRGLALRADDVPALVSSVGRLHADETLRNRMSHAGEAWSAGRDLRDMVRQMEELFVGHPDR